jgi:hypothetical protein
MSENNELYTAGNIIYGAFSPQSVMTSNHDQGCYKIEKPASTFVENKSNQIIGFNLIEGRGESV